MIALAWPGPTALVLVLIVAAWAVITGLLEIGAAFRAGEPAGARALFILGGLVSSAFGVALFARPDMGAITLALLFGLFNWSTGPVRSCRASRCAEPGLRCVQSRGRRSRREPARRRENTAAGLRLPPCSGDCPGRPPRPCQKEAW